MYKLTIRSNYTYKVNVDLLTSLVLESRFEQYRPSSGSLIYEGKTRIENLSAPFSPAETYNMAETSRSSAHKLWHRRREQIRGLVV